MTLAAVLCCAMMTTVFTACGGDDDDNNSNNPNNPQQSDTTPVYAYVKFKFENTADMLKYFNIEVVYQANDGQPQTFGPLTDKDVDSKLTFGLESAPTIPVKLTYYRKVTVKDEYKDTFASLEKFNWTNCVTLSWALYNANKKLIPGEYRDPSAGITGAPTGEKMLDNLEKGVLDYIYTVAIDEKGIMTFSHQNPER